MLPAIGLVLFLQLAGEAAARGLGLPVPGSLIGMAFLLALLVWQRDVSDGLQRLAQGLLRHMMLLLIPAVAGIAVQYPLLARDWLPFLLSCAVGAMLTVAVTGWTLRFMMQRTGAKARA